MLIDFPNESSLDFERKYADFVYIIDSTFEEYIDLGWEKISAGDKTIYDVESMMEDDFSTIIISVQLCYLFAREDLAEFFDEIYNGLRMKYKKNIFEFPNLIKRTESKKIESEVKAKVQKIADYAEKLYGDGRDII